MVWNPLIFLCLSVLFHVFAPHHANHPNHLDGLHALNGTANGTAVGAHAGGALAGGVGVGGHGGGMGIGGMAPPPVMHLLGGAMGGGGAVQ